MKEKLKVFSNGLLKENPSLRLVLGTCPTYREIWASQAPEEEGEDGTR